MHHPRLAAVVALAASLLPGAVAHAAPKPVCNLLTDAANDVRVGVPQYGPMPYAQPAIDIRSVDVVSDAQGLGVTMRVGGIGATSTSVTHSSLGIEHSHYLVFLTIESSAREIGFRAQVAADNATGYAWYTAYPQPDFSVGNYFNEGTLSYQDEAWHRLGPARGVVDPAKSEIRMSVSWPDLAKYGYRRAKRDRAVKVRARTMDWWVSNRHGDPFDPEAVRYESAPRDDAAGNAAYPIGAKTCTTRA